MTAAVLERAHTVDDLEGLDNSGYELVNGELQERNVSMVSSDVAIVFGFELGLHVYPRRLGRIYGSDATYRIFGSPSMSRSI